MTSSELLHIRLYNQLLLDHDLKEVSEVVSRMGAMQSQSLDLAKWATGVRLKNKTVADINESLNKGEIIRTHILRPTWHFVSAEDIHWMFDLSNPRLKPIYQSYCKTLSANETLIYRAIPIVEKALSNGKHLTKQEIGDVLNTYDIKVDARHLTLIISYAEMEGILCNGQLKGNKQTFTSLEEWVPRTEKLHKDEALARLALRYFISHGPATLNDFTWWSGLTLTESKKALEMIKSSLVSESVNGRIFWMRNDIQIPSAGTDLALLLPPFDEFVVSYKDRSELIEDTHYSKVMTKNGLFSPTVMLNGRIVGSWKKEIKKGKLKVELSFFEKTPKKAQKIFKPEIKRVEDFY